MIASGGTHVALKARAHVFQVYCARSLKLWKSSRCSCYYWITPTLTWCGARSLLTFDVHFQDAQPSCGSQSNNAGTPILGKVDARSMVQLNVKLDRFDAWGKGMGGVEGRRGKEFDLKEVILKEVSITHTHTHTHTHTITSIQGGSVLLFLSIPCYTLENYGRLHTPLSILRATLWRMEVGDTHHHHHHHHHHTSWVSTAVPRSKAGGRRALV